MSSSSSIRAIRHSSGNGGKSVRIIVNTIGGRNGQPKQTISYMAERLVGQGSFGIVFQVGKSILRNRRVIEDLEMLLASTATSK